MNNQSAVDYACQQISQALIFDKSWVHRVVQTIEYDSGQLLNSEAVSLDVTIPRLPTWQSSKPFSEEGLTWNQLKRKNGSQIPVPLGMLKKGTIEKLDISLEGKTLPVLTTKQNREVFVTALKHSWLSLAEAYLTEESLENGLHAISLIYDSRPDKNLHQHDHEAIQNFFADIDVLISAFSGSPKELNLLTDFADTVSNLEKHYVLCALIPADNIGKRLVIKYKISGSADKNHLVDQGPSSYLHSVKFKHVLSTWWKDASFHFDLTVPQGIVISNVVHTAGREIGIETTQQTGSQRFHCQLTWKASSSVPLTFELVPVRQTSRQWNFWLSVIFFCGYLTTFITQIFTSVQDFSSLKSATTIVLVVPALLLSWLARTHEHPLVASVLKPLRLIFVLQALTLFATALTLSLQVHSIWTFTWVVIYLSALLISLYSGFVHLRMYKK